MNTNVNPLNMLFALDFYHNTEGFEAVSAPIVVDADTDTVTKPEKVLPLIHDMMNEKHYVASGEQSFIQLYKEGKLPKNREFMFNLTPCYRSEMMVTDQSLLMFLKLELIYVPREEDNTPEGLRFGRDKLCHAAKDCFIGLGAKEQDIKFVATEVPEQFDIEINGIEVGSYGIRTIKFENGEEFSYAYGTGLAEPRFSQAVSKGK